MAGSAIILSGENFAHGEAYFGWNLFRLAKISTCHFFKADSIEFIGSVGDGNGVGDIASVVWTSDLDNEIGVSTVDESGTVRLTSKLSAGSHGIVLTVTDRVHLARILRRIRRIDEVVRIVRTG